MRKLVTLLLAMVVSLTALPAAAARPTPDLIHAYKVLSVECKAGPSQTVRAVVKTRMTVVNYHSVKGNDWATNMEVKARLIPTTEGLNFTRAWKSAKTPYLTQDKRHAHELTVTTDNVSSMADWQVEIKLIWVRPGPVPNVAKTIKRPFIPIPCDSGTAYPQA